VGGLCRVQVNSEQVGLESLAEAGERLGRPDMSRCRYKPAAGTNTFVLLLMLSPE